MGEMMLKLQGPFKVMGVFTRLLALVILCYGMVFVGGKATAQSQSLLNTILGSGVIKIGTTGDYPPFSGRVTATGAYEGFDIDVAEKLAADLGVKLELVQTSWDTLVAGIGAGKYAVAASGITVTLERLKAVAFADPYLRPTLVPIIDKKSADKFKSWKDLDKPGVKIALQLGTAAEEAVKRRFKNAELYSVNAPVIDYTEILAGRADATVTENLYFMQVIGKEYPNLAMVDPNNPLEGSFVSLMTVQGDQVWLNWLNAWVREKQEQGFFDALNQKWLLPK
jgi:cyclohexadienyl dehydratase